jgi:hypothetical protein
MFKERNRRRSLFPVLSFALCACIAPITSSPQVSVPPQKTPERPSSAAVRVQQVVNACVNPAAPNKAGFAPSDPLMFGWSLFLTINCPAQNGPAQPVVWETWKPNYAVYLPGGKPPAPWGTLPPRLLLDQPEIDGYTLLDRTGQPILEEIRMNKAAFQYVVQRQLYSKAAQLKFFNDSSSSPISFPKDSLEIKAAWLILAPGDPRNARYYTIQSSYVDLSGQSHKVLAGLTGLHISSKLLPNWFWTSFEQVDNQVRTQAPQTVLIPPNVQNVNATVHAALPAGSVWRYYNMRGTQIAFTNSDGSPALLSNTQLETNFQLSSSCITCHDLATRGSLTEGRLGFFQMTSKGVRGYTGAPGAPSNQYFDAFQKRVCYDGSRLAFTDCKTINPAIVYKRLDYVWSLREAN